MASFENVWDALEQDPVKRENLKQRSKLLMAISQYLEDEGIKQTEAAELLGISQSRVSKLMNGKINDFRLDMLFNFAIKLGLTVTLSVAV